MKNKTEGIVISTDDSIAKVKVNRHGECSNCGSCPGESAMIFNVYNILNAIPGQRVVIEVQEVNMLRAAFVVYIMPIALTLVGLLIGLFIAHSFRLPSKIIEASTGLIAFILSIFMIKSFDKSAFTNKNNQPIMKNILT